VVGHVEWVQFARVGAHAARGEVVHARDPLRARRGGAVAAVQLARLPARRWFDHRARARSAAISSLAALARGSASACNRPAGRSHRHAVTLLDDRGERPIVTFGRASDPAKRTPSCRGAARRGGRRELHGGRPGGRFSARAKPACSLPSARAARA